jgi:hypothetical protein
MSRNARLFTQMEQEGSMSHRIAVILGFTVSLFMPISASETGSSKNQAEALNRIQVSHQEMSADIADIETKISRWRDKIEQNNTLPPGFRQQANAPLLGEIRRLQALMDRLKKQ